MTQSTITDELRFVLQNIRLRPSDKVQADIVEKAIKEIDYLNRRLADLQDTTDFSEQCKLAEAYYKK